jgi:hypothetical protein
LIEKTWIFIFFVFDACPLIFVCCLFVCLSVCFLRFGKTKSGRYVTEAEVEGRVVEMEKTRDGMLERLEYTARQQAQQAARRKH